MEPNTWRGTCLPACQEMIVAYVALFGLRLEPQTPNTNKAIEDDYQKRELTAPLAWDRKGA